MITTADRFEIYELLALHAHVFDANELDRVDELFTPDATYDMRSSGLGLFTGVDQLRAAAGQMFASGHAPRAHHLTNVVVTHADDDTATVRSKALMIMSDGGFHSVTYDDTVRRLDGRWRVSSRVITPAGASA
ncbi:MAG TPA: nuclear transport factor 2 family protein [Friedmanniella sp.]